MNWSEILRKGGVPEPPGYIETVAKVSTRPKRQKKKPKRNSKRRKIERNVSVSLNNIKR